MRGLRKLRLLARRRHWQLPRSYPRAQDELRSLTERFCQADTRRKQLRRATLLFCFISAAPSERRFTARLLRWIRLMEQNAPLRQHFQQTWAILLADFDSIPLLTETGLPSHHALPAELVRRVFEQLLPSARDECDSARFLAGVFASSAAVNRFIGQPAFVFRRFVDVLWQSGDTASAKRLQEDLRQAISLLSIRVAGRATSPALRKRGGPGRVERSPFYQLVFATETLTRMDGTAPRASDVELWHKAAAQCFEELEQVHLHMEHAGVSSALVYDLRSVEVTLQRLQRLTAVYAASAAGIPDTLPGETSECDLRTLTHALIRGRLEDMRLRPLVRDNLNLLARKTVERTGQGGEHYIAHSRNEYWAMWRAAAGGGLLTVFTAALKMRIIEAHLPLAVEGFFISTDYAVSFLLLQVFGFALATKQPSMTAATLAGIVRQNRGVARWSKISAFAADICRTQLAAAFSNVLAVCAGAVVFEKVWRHLFRTHYLPAASAQHVYQTLHPFTSGTAIFAAFTGVLLWLAALIGGWFENFAVFHRIPEAISQHPLGGRVGVRTMRRLGDWLQRNAGSWSTSVVLGLLLGFSPVVARFFGVPLDVRHVTLSTGTLALAAARFGTSSFEQGWLYYAIAGLAITFVLNLGVSFSIASVVALRAYEVPREEQWRILRFLLREVRASPLSFVFPPPEKTLSFVVAPGRDEPLVETRQTN